MSTAASNDFSFFVGSFGLMSAVVSAIFFGRSYLPSAAMKELDEAYLETKKIYDEAVSQDLLPDALFRMRVDRQLVVLENIRVALREEVCQILGLWDEFLKLLAGLSTGIFGTTHSIRKLRRLIVTTTQENRKRRETAARRAGLLLDDTIHETESLLSHVGTTSSSTSLESSSRRSSTFALFTKAFSGSGGGSWVDTSALSYNKDRPQPENKFCFLCFFHLHQHASEISLPVCYQHETAAISTRPLVCNIVSSSESSSLHFLEVTHEDFAYPGHFLTPDAIRQHPCPPNRLPTLSPIKAPSNALTASRIVKR